MPATPTVLSADEVLAILSAHTADLRRFGVKSLGLFGSVARGDGFTYPADEPSPGTGQQFGRAPGYPLFLAAH